MEALRLSGCPGGATLLDDGRRLRCVVGSVAAPPAITAALDLTARVSGEALQGDEIDAVASVRAPGVEPDRERANCPVRLADGCQAAAPNVAVSAAPAVELRKYLSGVNPAAVDGVAGRQLTWRLDAVVGADGDVRGSSHPVGAPWMLPDWWQATGRVGRALDLPVKLVGCAALDERTDWTCAQPGGGGEPVDVTIERLGLPAGLADGVTSSLPQVVGSLQLDLWVPEAEVLASGWDVTFQNCFATQPGDPTRALWAPVDARGQPNLGGIPEPAGNNCAAAILPVPRPPQGGSGRRPPTPGSGDPPRPPPRATPTPEAAVSKHYAPITQGASVTDGTQFAAEVAVRVFREDGLAGVMACDKWDNSTHALRDGGVAGVRVWWQMVGEDPVEMEPAAVIVEYAKGPWGRNRPAQSSVGRGWYVQATANCADTAASAPPGWVTADGVDFSNQGRWAIDARDVNMVRARFVDPLPAGIEVWIEVLLEAGRSHAGTWLMNYGAAAWGTGTRPWHSEECFGAQGTGTRRQCPLPAAGARGRPGPLGDMLRYVGVPVWVTKHNDPPVPGGSPIVNAGQVTAFRLEASTFPRPDDPPPPEYPAGAYAGDVVITDTLPAGLYYEVGSATIASEDINGNGLLDPGEDTNGNGLIDADVPFEPSARSGPATGETTLAWQLGDLGYERRAPAIRFLARVSRLVRGGTTLTNWADVAADDQPPPLCRRPYPERTPMPVAPERIGGPGRMPEVARVGALAPLRRPPEVARVDTLAPLRRPPEVARVDTLARTGDHRRHGR